MEQTQNQLTIADRIKLPFYFDPEPLIRDINDMNLGDFIYYDVQPLRSPAHIVDPSLPPPPPADDYADGSWTDWKNTTLLDNAKNIKTIVDFFSQHCSVTLVRLLRLEVGAVVAEHTDPTLGMEIERSVVRLTIPIISEKSVAFYLNHTEVPMRPGECWYLRLTDPHSIEHKGQHVRINLTIDMRPNDWLTEQLNLKEN